MDKLGFWLAVGVVAVIAVWGFKFFASQTSISGLQEFAQAI